MFHRFFLVVAALSLVACGHSQIDYTPGARAGMTWERAASIVERGFYEDYGDQKTQAVQITHEAIILSDGSITTGTHAGTAVPVYGAAVVVGSSTSKTVSAGQRIYLSSLQRSIVLKRNGRDHRFAVIVRTEPGITARRIFFREERRAEEFADSLEYLRLAVSNVPVASVAAPVPVDGGLTPEQYRRGQLERLMQENLSYDEYQRRLKQIEAQ